MAILTGILDEHGSLDGFLDEQHKLVADLSMKVTVGGYVVTNIGQNEGGDLLFTLSTGDQVVIAKFFQGPKGDPGPEAELNFATDAEIETLF